MNMTPDELRRIIGQPESLKLDFKREYHLSNAPPSGTNRQEWSIFVKGQWDEFIKDLLALANGNVGTARHNGRLIIGVGDELLPNGMRELYDTHSLDITQHQILAKVNAACDPPLPDVFCERLILDGKNIVIITIPPTADVHETTRQLVTTKGEFDGTGRLRHSAIDTTYTAYTVFVRRGEHVHPATGRERQALAGEKSHQHRGERLKRLEEERHELGALLNLFNRQVFVAPERVETPGDMLEAIREVRVALQMRGASLFRDRGPTVQIAGVFQQIQDTLAGIENAVKGRRLHDTRAAVRLMMGIRPTIESLLEKPRIRLLALDEQIRELERP